RTISASDHISSTYRKILGRMRSAVPAVSVSGNQRMATPAQQLVHWLPAGFADQIPHGDLDAADGGHHSRATLVLISNHAADHRFDIERIAAQNPRFDPFMQNSFYRLLLPLERGFAD